MTLNCSNIAFQYPGTSANVFQGLSFRLERPGFDALFGPSGVGKTSLARIIVGELDGYHGDIRVEGMSRLFYSYNMERLPDWSSVGRHLEKITPASKSDRKEALVDAFGMASVMGLRFSQLSLGQQNRINLMRYLLQDFELLIMDESLANVDEKTRESIILKIKAMYPERYFLYISHNVVEVSKFCRDIIVLRGPGKQPQTVGLKGIDMRNPEDLDRDRLEKTMLEIMNAS
ncbi:MAG: ATP-binding cassette domain-containing protein [Deltaproteobacteria bacterium]|jgi:ABC-type multidrug transport system ATPase subunit|nr:ATP-binding cassette domain-containing protein [Deltaproteobacteria bacterium]